MLRALMKTFFLTRATVEIGRERLEDYFDLLAAKTEECKASSSDHLKEAKDQLAGTAFQFANKIQERAQWLEKGLKEKISEQMSDLSLNTFEDAPAINELKAEIAALRAEISELKTRKAAI